MACFKIEKDSSLVRIFNASQDAQAVDVYIDNKLLFENIKFKDFTKYIKVKEGDHQVDVYPSKTNKIPIISEVLEIEDKEMITVAVTGEKNDLSLLVIPDYTTKKVSEKYSSFRVIHLSPNEASIDILVDKDILFKDIEFRDGTNYADVNPGEYKVDICQHQNGKVDLQLKIKLNPKRIYTVYVIGNKENLEAIQSVDGNNYLCKE